MALKVPVSWLREYVDFDLPVEELARQLVFTSCEVDRVVRRGVPDEDGNLGLFRVGRVVEAGKHPNADRLQLCHVDVGEGEPRQIVCGAWNFGAGRDRAGRAPGRAPPGCRPAARRGQAPGRAVARDDPVRARARARHRPHRDHRARRRARAGNARSPTCSRVSETVLEIETGFNRPDLTGDLRHRARGGGAHRRRARSAAGRRSAARRRRAGRRARRGPRGVPALRRPALPRRSHRAVAAVAARAPDRRRHAPDLERRGRDELRHARARQPAARLRPQPPRRGAHRRAARAARRGDPHARRQRPRARARRPRDRRRAAARSPSPGSWAARTARSPTRRPRCCSRRRTSSRSSSCARRGGCGCAPSRRRAGRRASTPTPPARRPTYASQLLVELAGARWVGETDVRGDLPERPVARHEPVLVGSLSGMDIPLAEQQRAPRAPRLRGRRRLLRHRADLARARRDPLGRPRRGGRPLPHGGRAVDAAAPAGDVRPAHARAAPAPAGRGRARRRGLPRGVHVVARPGRRRPDRAARAVLGRAGCAAHRPRARAARVGAAERERGRRARGALRGRARLPAERRRPARRALARRRHHERRLRPCEGRGRDALPGAARRAGVRRATRAAPRACRTASCASSRTAGATSSSTWTRCSSASPTCRSTRT